MQARFASSLAEEWSGEDTGKLKVERGIVGQQVDDVKTAYSKWAISIDKEMLSVFKTWKQTAQFSAQEDRILRARYS